MAEHRPTSDIRASTPDAVRLAVCPHPFAAERVDLSVEAGLTIAEILEVSQADPVLRRFAVVYVGDHLVPREHWRCVRPKPGCLVAVRVVPQGGDRKVLRTLLTIAVVAAATAVPQLIFSQAFLATTLGTVVGGLVAGGVAALGTLAINALVPPPKPKLPDLSGDPRTSGFLSGARNRLDVFGVVPRVLGKHRMTPPFAARPYTEVAGDDQFLRVLLCWGYGPLTLPADLKIGETAIEEFDEVEVEHVQGFGSNPRGFGPADVDTAADRIAVPSHGFLEGQIVEVTSDSTPPGGLAPSPQHFAPADVDAVADRIAIADHGLADGQPIELASDGTLPGGLRPEARYFVVGSAQNDFQLTSAPGGAPVDLMDGGGGSHGIVAGHFVLNATANDFRLAATETGAALDLTGGGAGAHLVRRMVERITLFTEDVFEQGLTVALDETFQIRTTQPETDEISFDITFPAGLVRFEDDGDKRDRSVTVEAQYSPAGQNDWSAGALGKVFAARTVALAAPPSARVYREARGESYTVERRRIDRVVMDRYSGALTVLRGQPVETAVIAGSNPRFEPSETVPPPSSRPVGGAAALPADKLGIAQVLRISGESAVSDALITDERAPDATDPAFGPADFAPSESTPPGRSLEIGGGTLTFAGVRTTARKAVTIRRSLRFRPPQRGQFDVRLRRTTPEAAPGGRVVDQVVWTALRSITQRNPVNMDGLAMTALRVKRSDQLEGQIEAINGVVESILPDWDGSDWTPEPTRNPAAVYREVLQGPANARGLADSRIDLAMLQDWHEKNTAQGFTFDQVIDFPATVLDTLAETAAAGRAMPTLGDGKWGVVIDEPQSVPIQHFTPRNSWGFFGRKAFPDLPHGFRVRFVNAEKDWRQDERIVTRDGFTDDTATRFEGLELPGVTDAELIWRHARFHLAQAELRPEMFTWFADLEAIVCTRGDLVLLTHDAILVGLATGRITQVILDGAGDATQLVLDEAVPMEAGKSYGLSIRKDDGDNALTAAIETEPGAQTTVTLTTPVPAAQALAAGQLFGFGETGLETLEVIVKAVEPGADLSFRITAVPAAPAVHRADDLPLAFLPTEVDALGDRIVKTNHGLVDGDLVSVTSDGTLPGGLLANPQTIASVDQSQDKLLLAGHGLADGQVVLFANTGGKLPAGLRPGRKYFVVGATADDFRVSVLRNGPPVALADPGSGSHRVEASHVVTNATPDDFQLAPTPGGAAVDLVDGGTGGHTATRLVPPFDSGTTPPVGIAAPAVDRVLSDGSVLERQPDGSYTSRILATLFPAAGLRADLAALECQYRVSGADVPYARCPAVPAGVREVSIAPVEDGETYDFRLRYVALDGTPGPWGPTVTHSVLGKSAPPADVTGFSAQQNGPVVTFSWHQVPDLDLQGYEIRFGPPGIAWEDADPLTQVTRGTRITTASVPPGTFDFHIRAKDNAKPATPEGGNFSANSAVVALTVTSALDVIEQREQHPAWSGAASGFLRNPLTGDLNPDSNALAAADAAQAVFDTYVWDPVAAGSYESPEIALGFIDQVRAWAGVRSVLGPGETGLAAPTIELDAHDGGGYDGFEPWTIGELEARFVKFRVSFDFSVGLVILKGFEPTVDLLENEVRDTLAVGLGGQTVVFPERFHNTPQVIVDAEAVAGALRFARKSNVTESGFDVTVVDSANTDVGGTVTYSARGV
jgi:hypothetical protein